jgi:anaerobic sulfite reductase subunit A
MKSVALDNNQAFLGFSRLVDEYEVWGPVRFKGRGRFSDTDLIKYARIKTFADLELHEKSSLSPKSIVFPADETIFYFNADAFSAPDLNEKPEIIVLLRPCDINGIERLDRIFLQNGDVADPYYQRRRSRIHFFMIECRESFENCFCVSMGTNISYNYAAALRFDNDLLKIHFRTPEFMRFFSPEAVESDFLPEYVDTNEKKVILPEIDKMPEKMFAHKMWEEYDSRCIACGRCNTSCVTSSCFSTHDIFYPDSRQCGERRRVWDGCHLDGFTDMAGGHSFRRNKGERMRFKTFHKVYDFRRRFGVNMCVGCGRCDDVCPEYISFSACVNRLARTLEEKSDD